MPAFHRKRIEEYQETMREVTAKVIGGWRPVLRWISGATHKIALIIAGRTLLNMDLAGSARDLGQAVATVVQAVSNPLNIALAQVPFDMLRVGKGGTLRRSLQRIDVILKEIIEQHEREGKDTGDVVSMLVSARDEEGKGLTTQEIRTSC